MQFKYATLAVMATAVLATAPDSTVYQTEEVTITSCAPTVTDCPAHSTVTSLTSYPVPTTTEAPEVPTSSEEPEETLTSYTTIVNTITSCHPTVTDCPVGQETTITVPCSETPAVPTTTEAPVVPTTTEAPVVPTTTEAPITVTVTINSCPAETPSWTSVPVVPTTTAGPTNPGVPTISGFPQPSNGTSVTPPKVTSPPIGSGASAVSGSIFAVGFAAMAAVFFA